MSLALRQYQRIYHETLVEFLKEGKVPSFSDITHRAGNRLPNSAAPVEPIYSFVPQTASSVFDIIIYNRAIKDIRTDLDLLFNEINEIQLNNIKRILHADLFQNIHAYELGKLRKELDALLFSLEGADENFFAKFESFNDFSKTDTTQTTTGIVDLNEGLLSLPISAKGVMKVDLNHLITLDNPRVTIENGNGVNRGNIAGTKFSNIFADSITPWGIIVESSEDQEIAINFTFRLRREEFVNRISLIHHGDKPQRAFVSTSVDNVNKHQILEYANGVILDDQSKEVSLDFDDTLVDYVHVRILKTASDSSETDANDNLTYRYMFGLRNISLYMTGRTEEAVYISQPFDFAEQLDAVGKIAVSASELLPDKTYVDWSVAVTDDNDEIVGSYIPITPQSRKNKGQSPKTINIQNVIANDKKFTSTADSYSSILTFQNIDYYKIATVETEPVFGTTYLHRGEGSWLRDTSQAVNPMLVRDNFVPFSRGATQTVYNIKQEVVPASLLPELDTQQTIAIVSNSPLYNTAKGHILIPEIGMDPGQDTQPLYAIYSAQLSVYTPSVIATGVTFETVITYDLENKNILYSSTSDITVIDEGDQYQYVDGVDYIIEQEAGYPTGKITALPDSNLRGYTVDEATVYPVVTISATVDPDILRFVSNISGNQIYFDFDISSVGSSHVIVKYRHPANEVIKSSVKVKKFFGSAGDSHIYVQGQDYIFDSNSSSIQWLSTGTIDAESDVYVDYKYNDLSVDLQQFFVWAYVGDADGVNIITEKATSTDLSVSSVLEPDSEAGEEFLVSIPRIGIVSLNTAVEWPLLTGWVQFVVKSLDPDVKLTGQRMALIDQVLKLRDEDSNYLFIKDGKYFSELTAIREPMTQVGFQHLKTKVLKGDDKYFAIRSVFVAQDETEHQVVVNFEPNTSNKLYTFKPLSTGQLVAADENWKITWTNKEIALGEYTKIIVKIVLTRSAETGGNITPKVYDYYVKTGF
jgi:hypothetical protein